MRCRKQACMAAPRCARSPMSRSLVSGLDGVSRRIRLHRESNPENGNRAASRVREASLCLWRDGRIGELAALRERPRLGCRLVTLVCGSPDDQGLRLPNLQHRPCNHVDELSSERRLPCSCASPRAFVRALSGVRQMNVVVVQLATILNGQHDDFDASWYWTAGKCCRSLSLQQYQHAY